MKKKIIIFFSLTLIVLLAALTPIFAKDLNYPTDVNRIDYINAGGQAEVALPALPSTDSALQNYPTTATAMRFSFSHIEVPNADKSFDTLLVWLYLIPSGASSRVWEPFAYFTTDPTEIAFQEAFWHGSFVNFDATLYYMNPPTNTIHFPSTWSTDNVIGVSNDVLQVVRHGNSVTVTLSASEQVKRPLQMPPGKSFVIPALTLELTKYGGSVNFVETTNLVNYLGASGYTFVNEVTGFNANGVVASPTAWLNGATAENAYLAMDAKHTYYPPTS